MKLYFRVHVGLGKWVDTKHFKRPKESKLNNVLQEKKAELRRKYPTGVICLKTEE